MSELLCLNQEILDQVHVTRVDVSLLDFSTTDPLPSDVIEDPENN